MNELYNAIVNLSRGKLFCVQLLSEAGNFFEYLTPNTYFVLIFLLQLPKICVKNGGFYSKIQIYEKYFKKMKKTFAFFGFVCYNSFCSI